MSNYQMTAVDSSISMAKLGKFCPGSRTERSCLPFCVPLHSRAHVRLSPDKPNTLSCYRESHCCHRDHAGDMGHAATSACVGFAEGEDTALMRARYVARPELGLLGHVFNSVLAGQ